MENDVTIRFAITISDADHWGKSVSGRIRGAEIIRHRGVPYGERGINGIDSVDLEDAPGYLSAYPLTPSKSKRHAGAWEVECEMVFFRLRPGDSPVTEQEVLEAYKARNLEPNIIVQVRAPISTGGEYEGSYPQGDNALACTTSFWRDPSGRGMVCIVGFNHLGLRYHYIGPAEDKLRRNAWYCGRVKEVKCTT
jgi:hypothetical protein